MRRISLTDWRGSQRVSPCWVFQVPVELGSRHLRYVLLMPNLQSEEEFENEIVGPYNSALRCQAGCSHDAHCLLARGDFFSFPWLFYKVMADWTVSIYLSAQQLFLHVYCKRRGLPRSYLCTTVHNRKAALCVTCGTLKSAEATGRRTIILWARQD